MSAFASQIHDYEPGIASNGLFWTVAIPPSAIAHDLAAGTASIKLTDFAIPDFTTVANSLSNGPSVPATVTFDMRVAPGTAPRRFEQVDSASGFRGQYAEGDATIAWSSKQDHFSFQSDAASTTTSLFAIVGRERNGVFFASPASLGGGGAGARPTAGGATAGRAGRSGSLPSTGGRSSIGLAGATALLGAVLGRRMRQAAD